MTGPKYKDYYKILGVSRGADEKDIKSAYRRLARKYHPDVNPGDKSAEERFKEISEAHDVLSDPHKRAQYDSFGDQWKAFSQGGQRPPGNPFGTGAESFEFGLGAGVPGGLNDFFESLFGGRQGRAKRAAARGEDVEFGIDVTLDEVMSGCVKEQSVTIEDACANCGGSGATRRARGAFDVGAPPCSGCRGHGRTPRVRRIKVKVPAGVEDGRRLCLKGQGGAGPDGTKGDLYLVVRIKPHPEYQLRDKDLHTDVDVPYTVAALGGEVQVRTLNGVRSLSVPPGVQSGQRIRVAGHGMPNPAGKPGDLYARLRLTVPKELMPRERELLTELGRLRGDTIRT
ncbi:MAG: J domain-containing protein [Armatimonadetes bacterium]|nr:J domain-containing protein [Armatimonadota bacterium]